MKDKWIFIVMLCAVLAVTAAGGLCYYQFVYVPSQPTLTVFKPIVYLYGQAGQNVNVKFGYPGLITTSYPEYSVDDGWNVTIQDDGSLYDASIGRSLYALYWEGKTGSKWIHYDEGFVVHRDSLIPFLERTLDQLGLSEREAEEFIIYWLPQLQESEYNYIYFESPSEIEANMPLMVDPAPDHVIRVMMTWKPLQYSIDIPAQELAVVDREEIEKSDFYVVEWGGTKF